MPKVDFEEGQTIEFKERYSAGKWLEDIASFANTNGGKLYFGIAKTRDVTGIHITAEDKDRVTQACASIEEPITVTFEEIRFDDKDVLVVNVPRGNCIPHFLSGAVWVRSSAITRPATREERQT